VTPPNPFAGGSDPPPNPPPRTTYGASRLRPSGARCAADCWDLTFGFDWTQCCSQGQNVKATAKAKAWTLKTKGQGQGRDTQGQGQAKAWTLKAKARPRLDSQGKAEAKAGPSRPRPRTQIVFLNENRKCFEISVIQVISVCSTTTNEISIHKQLPTPTQTYSRHGPRSADIWNSKCGHENRR